LIIMLSLGSSVVHGSAARDRTNIFMTLRNSHKSGYGTGNGMISIPISTNTLNDSLLNSATESTPLWVMMYETITLDLTLVHKKMEQLCSLHEQSLAVNVSGSASSKRNEQLKIDNCTHEITSQFSIIQNRIKKLSGVIKKLQFERKVNEYMIVSNIQQAVTMKLQSLSKEFQSDQQKFLNAVQVRNQKAQSAMGFSREDAELDGYVDKGFNDGQMKQLEMAQRDAAIREQQLKSVAQNVEQIAVLVKDIAQMVTVQGSLLDRIDYNINSAEENINKGVKELEKAEEYQRRHRNKMWIILLLVTIFCFSIVLFLKLTTT